MKTILSILLLTCLGLAAQAPPLEVPPLPTAAAAVTNAPASTAPGLPVVPVQNPAAGQGAVAPGLAAPGAARVAPPGGITPVLTPGLSPVAGQANISANAATAAAAPEEVFAAAKVIKYTGADLGTILDDFYAPLIGRTVLRSPTVETALKAPIFFVNQTPLTKSEAIQAYKALFAMNGVAFVEVDEKFMKVVPVAEAVGAAQKPLITTNAADLKELGQFVTHIVQLKYVKPTEMQSVLTPFMSGKIAAGITMIDSSQTLVLRDFTENVKRMLEMIEKVDVGGISEFTSEVIPIKYAKAEEIAQALSSLSGSSTSATMGTRPAGGGAAGGARPGVGGYNPNNPGGMTTPGALGTSATGTPSAAGSFSDRIRGIIQNASRTSTSGSGDFQIIGANKIVADVRANALIVFASRQDLTTIKEIIGKLDVLLSQVVIETVILDVTLDNTLAFSVSGIQTPKNFGGSFSGAGGVNAKNFTRLLDGDAAATNAFTDLIGTGLRYFGKVDDNWYVQLQAAATQGKINVVQKPRIQTSHAKPARIFIGGTVPYVQSSYYGGGYGGGPSSSYQQLPVGIGLQVTPFINADGLVVLQIDDFSIDEISGATEITGVGAVPNTTKRQLLGEIAVLDGETIMLGGFVRDYQKKANSGIPILKDIPVLGALFSSRGTDKTRSELLVLMKPTVLRTPEMASAQVATEKRTMPGVVSAESEMKINDVEALERSRKEVDELDKKRFKKVTPFTEEEKRLYGTP